MEMTTDEFHNKVNQSLNMADQSKGAKQLIVDIKAAKKILDEEIVRFNIDNMAGITEHKNKKLITRFKRKVRIQESKSNHGNRVTFLKRLIDAGYGEQVKVFESATIEDNKIAFHDEAYVDGRIWDNFIDSIPANILEQAKIDGLIWIDIIPEVTVK